MRANSNMLNAPYPASSEIELTSRLVEVPIKVQTPPNCEA